MSLRGKSAVHCELFSMKKLRAHLSLFSRKKQVYLADELERELSLSARVGRERGRAAGL